MKSYSRTAMAIAALIATTGVAGIAHAGGTIPSGPYETICDKNPSACGEDIVLKPRPKPKPPKPKPQPKPTQYTPIGKSLSTSYTSIPILR